MSETVINANKLISKAKRKFGYMKNAIKRRDFEKADKFMDEVWDLSNELRDLGYKVYHSDDDKLVVEPNKKI